MPRYCPPGCSHVREAVPVRRLHVHCESTRVWNARYAQACARSATSLTAAAGNPLTRVYAEVEGSCQVVVTGDDLDSSPFQRCQLVRTMAKLDSLTPRLENALLFAIAALYFKFSETKNSDGGAKPAARQAAATAAVSTQHHNTTATTARRQHRSKHQQAAASTASKFVCETKKQNTKPDDPKDGLQDGLAKWA